MSLHAALLGTGDWARIHLAALRDSPHVDRVTLCGRNQAAASALAAAFPVVRHVVADVQQVLDDPTVDLVHVVVPHYLHASHTQAALRAGKHVICEKPGAIRLADLDESIRLATATGRRLLIVLNQLYNPLFIRLRELVAAGTIGQPFLSVENSFRSAAGNYRRLDYWRCTPAMSGGGTLIDGGFHMVYRHLDTLGSQGRPTWISAETAQLCAADDGTPVPTKGEDFVSATVGYDGPLRIQWAHGWTLPANVRRSRQSFLGGTEGILELTDRRNGPLILRKGAKAESIALDSLPLSGMESAKICLLDYLSAIVTGQPPVYGTLDVARTALAVVLGVYESAQTARQVAVQ